ncbi:MAG: 5'/3'-nucleotidase SurE [Planctomycetaceae bacterium]|jgi:5'-nucleotidase|nr:5'/3'-nucleotidase SurE [Planctomycetaceae bacterium]
MKILLTNDDGIHAPGLAAMAIALQRLGEVTVVAPATEQSGVGHAITFQTPLTTKRTRINDMLTGYALRGTPADCVKIGITQIFVERPDLIVSGINGGLNAGLNVIYSGTVAAAVEGAFYGIDSIAVSLEYSEYDAFTAAAAIAANVIEKLVTNKTSPSRLYNLNIPVAATINPQPEVKVVPMDITQYWETFEKRIDPLGRPYYWLTGRPDPRQPKPQVQPDTLTDLKALNSGFVTVTPLQYDMTDHANLNSIKIS